MKKVLETHYLENTLEAGIDEAEEVRYLVDYILAQPFFLSMDTNTL